MVFKVFWGERRKKKGGIQVTGLMSWEQERVRATLLRGGRPEGLP